MKKLLLIIIMIFTLAGARSQGCLPEGITFSNQSQIDNFQSNYPGCTEIEGDVTIIGDDITDISSLNVITTIGGNLVIGTPGGWNANPALVNLSGLENLNSIGGDLSLESNGILTSLSGLESLSAIGGSLWIRGNLLLDSITSLGSLTSIGGGLYIGTQSWAGYLLGNPLLTSLDGLEGITSLTHLSIIDNNSLPDLTGLDNLQSISGSLTIGANETLSSLAGLGSLTYIGENLQLGITGYSGSSGNPALGNLTGLEGITQIGGSLTFIGGGPASFEGLNNLVTIGGDFTIQDDNIITNLEGIDNLNSIGGNFLIGQYPGLGGAGHVPGGNPSLESLTGTYSLTSIGGDLVVGMNDTLTSLAGLENITSIGGDLIIHSNDVLSSLASLDSVNFGSIENLDIHNNPLLSDCQVMSICSYLASPNGAVDIYSNAEGCDSPSEVASNCGLTTFCLPFGNYYFYAQADIDNFQTDYPGCSTLGGETWIMGGDITNLNGLSTVTSIEGNLLIWYDSTLTSLAGLENVPSIAGNLEIYKNILLSDLSGLEALNSIGGALKIRGNDELTSLSGLDNLASVGGTLEIAGNKTKDLTGLGNLMTIGGGLRINGYKLQSLAGLNKLSSIGGNILISSNNLLSDISDLIHVTAISGSLILYGNNALSSLTGLDSIQAGTIININISNNYSLSTCHVQSICEYLSAPNGTVEIHDNANGCDSVHEVLDACLVRVPQEVGGQRLAVSSYPNPTNGVSSFGFRVSGSQQQVTLKIYDLNGRELAVVLDEVMPAGEHTVSYDASGLPAGVYYYRLAVGSRRLAVGGKLVKY